MRRGIRLPCGIGMVRVKDVRLRAEAGGFLEGRAADFGIALRGELGARIEAWTVLEVGGMRRA